MRFAAFDAAGAELANRVYYSVGGGFVVSDEVAADGTRAEGRSRPTPPCCRSRSTPATELLALRSAKAAASPR